MDKIYQAIQEVLIEVSDEDKAHLDSDVIHKIANRIAAFISKGVGNLNPVYDLLVLAHSEGKYPANTPQGSGANLRDYANRMAAMFAGAGAIESLKKGGMVVSSPSIAESSHRGLTEERTLPVPPKASEKEPLNEQT